MRKESDAYMTPLTVIDNFIKSCPYYFMGVHSILEPCAGSGSFLQSIKTNISKFDNSKSVQMDAVELREEEKEKLGSLADHLTIGNFLTWKSDKKYDLIITNPPYSLAEEFVQHSFDLVNKDKGTIIMLLRINFLGSQHRYDFWHSYPLYHLHPLSCRPSFTKSGTDQTEYAWFVWSSKYKSESISNVWGRSYT